MYYDSKFEKISFSIILSITLLRAIAWMLRGYLIQNGSDGSTLISMVIGIAVICIIHATAKNAADSFSSVQNNMETLMQRIADMDGEINHLLRSNDTIIANISQLPVLRNTRQK